jgi:flagellar motor protein MotB
MYLRDNVGFEDLGRGQNYLGAFPVQAGLAQGESANCLPQKYIVARFRRGSKRLRDIHKKRIRRIASRILYCITPVLRSLPAPQGIDLKLELEGHVDAKTDPVKYNGLDDDRAIAVHDYLVNQIYHQLERKGLPPKVSMVADFKAVGSQRPLSSKYPMNNRRVEVRIRWQIGSRP